MNRPPNDAATLAGALGQRAEAVCRRYLSAGRRQGRYWVAGDVHGAKGRSLFVRLRPPGTPGKWTDAATGEHGDLLDLLRAQLGTSALRPALDEARAFLALPAPAPAPGPGDGEESVAERVTRARRLWGACRPLAGTPAEAYLRERAIARCRFPALRFHPQLHYRDEAGFRRFPALVAAVTEPGGYVTGVHRTWLDPHRPAKAPVAAARKTMGRIYGLAVRFGRPVDGASLLVGEGMETVLSLLTAVPALAGAAALAAGSLGAFSPPPGVSRLLIARDGDPEGEAAAERLAMRCAEAGIDTTVLVPERGDFNDDLRALGAGGLARRVGRSLVR